MYYGCTQAPKTETVPATIGADGIDRTVLPIKEPIRPTYKELDVRNATPPARFEVKAPAKAPNIVIILIDDMGFGVSESFGGPISMPTLDKLAQNGSPCKNHYPVFGQA
ncbi:MAG: sulfatase-like hydrolase/transferase [Bacteroidales bacterium]|nr:sulfatase-like hydrolase/transferase [Bacteroidales bacterium]